MTQQTLGGRIAALRKEKGMTQLELAQQMGVTDKAVSKWERIWPVPISKRCLGWPSCLA